MVGKKPEDFTEKNVLANLHHRDLLTPYVAMIREKRIIWRPCAHTQS